MGLKMFPDLRKLLLSIGRSFVSMKDITMIILFVFTIYAVIGLQVSITLFIIIILLNYYNNIIILKINVLNFFIDVERSIS